MKPLARRGGRRHSFLFFRLLLLATLAAAASRASADEPAADARLTYADTSSPKATLESFIDACNEINRRIRKEKYIDRSSNKHGPLARCVLECLDDSDLPGFSRRYGAIETAICLKEILDRVEIPDDVPDLDDIQAAGGPEKNSWYQAPGTRIVIARVEEGPRRHEYLFSAGTVARARSEYDDIKTLPYRNDGPETSPGLYDWFVSAPGGRTMGVVVERLPSPLRVQWYGLAGWKWVGGVGVCLLGVATIVLLYWMHSGRSRRFREEGRLLRYWMTIGLLVAAVCVPLLVRHIVIKYIAIRGAHLYAIIFGCDLVALLTLLPLIMGAYTRAAETIVASPNINPHGLDAQFTRIISRFLAMITIVIVFLEGGHYLGFPITTLLASAGVGGLAMALAAQDTLKNAFGTIMLMADKPFRVGDRIVFGKYDGMVEEIGLRSTRVRLLNGHQATIPNDKLAGSDIENVGRRPYIRRVADVRIPLDTPPDKLDAAIQVVREAVEDHLGQEAAFPPRVSFNEFNQDSFNIRMIYWFHPPNYWDFLAMCEEVNMKIYRGFEAAGIIFSQPVRIVDERPQETSAARGDSGEPDRDGTDSTDGERKF